MCTASDACPAAVCETRVQPGEAPQSGGGIVEDYSSHRKL